MQFFRKPHHQLLILLFLGIALASGLTRAAPVYTYADLGKKLTPFGAERQGNAAGTIPAWQDTPERNWDPAQEKPLFVITAENYRQHVQYLTAGQQALFTRYPTSFRMPVYPSRRDFVPPQRVMETTIANAPRMRISEGGYGITGGKGGIPFPIPSKPNPILVQELEQIVRDLLKDKEENGDSASDAFESKISQLVYSIYDLSENEIETIVSI